MKPGRAGGRTAAEAKLQQGQKVLAREHMVKAGSSERGMMVPDGPSCPSSNSAWQARGGAGVRLGGVGVVRLGEVGWGGVGWGGVGWGGVGWVGWARRMVQSVDGPGRGPGEWAVPPAIQLTSCGELWPGLDHARPGVTRG